MRSLQILSLSRCLGGNVQFPCPRLEPSRVVPVISLPAARPCQPYFSEKSGRAEGTGSHDTFHRSPHQPAAVRENSRWGDISRPRPRTHETIHALASCSEVMRRTGRPEKGAVSTQAAGQPQTTRMHCASLLSGSTKLTSPFSASFIPATASTRSYRGLHPPQYFKPAFSLSGRPCLSRTAPWPPSA